MSSARRTLLVVLVAVLGIALAAAVTWATSRLVSQHIGLASEPLSAGQRLLPRTTRTTTNPPRTSSTSTTPPRTTTTTTTTAPPITTTAPPPTETGGEGDSHSGDD